MSQASSSVLNYWLSIRIADFEDETPTVGVDTIPHMDQIPSYTALERVFSLGKDVLKSKRSGLSDSHFKMLVFLKETQAFNFIIFFIFSLGQDSGFNDCHHFIYVMYYNYSFKLMKLVIYGVFGFIFNFNKIFLL